MLAERIAQNPNLIVLAVSGSRRGATPKQWRALSALLTLFAPDVVTHGACKGVDEAAGLEALRRGLLVGAYPSEIEGLRACRASWGETLAAPTHPLRRNDLLAQRASVFLALPRGTSRGTWHAIGRARFHQVPLVVVGEDGKAWSPERVALAIRSPRS